MFLRWLLNFSRWLQMVLGGCRLFLLLVTTVNFNNFTAHLLMAMKHVASIYK